MKKLRMNEKVFGPKGILNDTTYNNGIKDQRYYNITVEQLLRHQAGFNNYAGDPVSSTRYIMMQNRLTTPPDHKTLLKILPEASSGLYSWRRQMLQQSGLHNPLHDHREEERNEV